MDSTVSGGSYLRSVPVVVAVNEIERSSHEWVTEYPRPVIERWVLFVIGCLALTLVIGVYLMWNG